MPRPLPLALRQHILDAAHQGLSPAAIALRLRLSQRTVRHLLHSWRQQPEVPSLAPDYSRCGRPCSLAWQSLRQDCLGLRRQHPGWGAQRLRLTLRALYPNVPLPCPRTLQLWLDQAGLSTPRPQTPCRPEAERRARAVHQVWQMDAAEHLRLRSGDEASWLRIVDEYSAAVLGTVVFPPRALASGARCSGPGRPAETFWLLGTSRADTHR
jgi:hypothetical protein